jgi:hypothetical protein
MKSIFGNKHLIIDEKFLRRSVHLQIIVHQKPLALV